MGESRIEPGGHRDGVFGLARQAGRILMVRNPRVSRGEARSWWDLPGGAARSGESLPGALAREWAEETGLSAQVGDLICVSDGVKRRPAGPILYTWRAFLFEVASEGEPAPGPGIDAVEWVPEADAAGRLVAPYHRALREVLAGATQRYAGTEWVEAAPAEATAGDPALPRDLLIIAAAGAVGDRATLRAQVERALVAGESAVRIEETLLQLVPYVGYPRAITAFGTVRALLGAPGDGRANAGQPSGPAVFDSVYGETAPEVRASLEALHPLLAEWTLGHAYGQVLARRPVLSLRERELLAVSILTAMGGLEEPLLGHMRAAVRLGAAAADVAAAVHVVPVSMGENRRAAALQLLERV